MLLTNPWRLTLLFFVSGAATRFMADKISAAKLAGKRTLRLLVPLVFAMIVIVPPQSYFEVVEKIGYSGTYLEFWGRYLAADGSFCLDGDCLEVPTWNHLWFVAYLLVYSLALAAALALFPQVLRRWGAIFGRAPAWALLLVPVLYFGVMRAFLMPMFEVTHALFDDWYNHAVSFPAFLLGFLIMKESRATETLVRLRWPALLGFAAAYAILVPYYWAYGRTDTPPPETLRLAMRMVYGLDQWCAIVAALGFGALHLNRDSPLLRTLTVAVFPFYIAHQTIIVVAGHYLDAAQLPLAVEAGLLIATTALGCWLTFELARRVDLLRPLFGLGPRPRGEAALEAQPVAP